MIGLIFRKIFGSRNDREVKRLRPLVARINQIEQELQSQPESVLREKTAAWKARLSTIQDNDELKRELEALIPEAFAVVKNACRRLCGTEVEVRGHPIRWEMVPFDVQLIGGMGLHLGRIAEMATGEGKTLVGTMPVYLNAPDWAWRACGDRQRLPGGARLRLDGPRLHVPRPHCRLHFA